MGFPGEVSYGAAKAALENYTMAASVELAADGITANVVYPPVTDTGWVTDDVRRFVAESTDHVPRRRARRGRRGDRLALHGRGPAGDRQRRPAQVGRALAAWGSSGYLGAPPFSRLPRSV